MRLEGNTHAEEGRSGWCPFCWRGPRGILICAVAFLYPNTYDVTGLELRKESEDRLIMTGESAPSNDP